MTHITPQLLTAAIGCQADIADRWAPVLDVAMAKFEINTARRAAAFLAQIGHESNLLTATAENLNYSAERLLQIFPAHFNPATAAAYARRPVAIANRVYASRNGNGPEGSGDGWRYRGQCPIQLTFKNNYLAAGQGIGVDLVANPDLIQVPRIGALVSAWYWRSRSCNEMADAGDFDGVSDLINKGRKTAAIGDANGYAGRLALYQQASKALA